MGFIVLFQDKENDCETARKKRRRNKLTKHLLTIGARPFVFLVLLSSCCVIQQRQIVCVCVCVCVVVMRCTPLLLCINYPAALTLHSFFLWRLVGYLCVYDLGLLIVVINSMR